MLGYLREKEWTFTSASVGQKVSAVALGLLNVFGIVSFTNILANSSLTAAQVNFLLFVKLPSFRLICLTRSFSRRFDRWRKPTVEWSPSQSASFPFSRCTLRGSLPSH